MMLYICVIHSIHGFSLKFITTILLLSLILLQTFSSFVMQAEYLLNKGYITNAFCVNKDKPQMHCNGKCYLAKQLNDQERQDQQAPAPNKEKIDAQPFFLPKEFSLNPVDISTKIKYHCTEELFASAFSHSVFHPPAV